MNNSNPKVTGGLEKMENEAKQICISKKTFDRLMEGQKVTEERKMENMERKDKQIYISKKTFDRLMEGYNPRHASFDSDVAINELLDDHQRLANALKRTIR